MRKIALSALLCLALSLSLAVCAETVRPDVDLINLDTIDAIDAIYALADAPEDNQGKVVRLQGLFTYTRWEGEDIFLLLSDGASCCAAQIEFVPSALPDDFDPLALSNATIKVQGALDIYDNGGYDDVRLIDAQIDTSPL